MVGDRYKSRWNDDTGPIELVLKENGWYVEWPADGMTLGDNNSLIVDWLLYRIIGWDAIPKHIEKEVFAQVVMNKL